MAIDLLAADLSAVQFQHISAMLYRLSGITLGSGKEGLVKARLSKRLRVLDLASFDEYMHYVEGDRSGQELTTMIDSLTTNKTSFFRDVAHFEFLKTTVLPSLGPGTPLRIWSAGCSSGEEPYSLAITLREELKGVRQRDARILATDLSTRVLAIARQATYDEAVIHDVPGQIMPRHFACVQSSAPRRYQVNEATRAMIKLAKLNLMGAWPMQGPFDAIFCRNVMIYFDRPTRERLVQRFAVLLRPGGHLFVGLSESLNNLTHPLKYVQPAVYVK